MMSRLAFRPAEFVGSTLLRAVHAAESVLEPSPPPRHTGRKILLSAVGLLAAAAAALGAKQGLAQPDHREAPTSTNGRRPQSSSAKKTAAKTAERSREELYELARKAGIAGRSQMTKAQLEKALRT